MRPTTCAELIALAKSKPGALNYGSTGIGNPLHLTMEMLKSAAGMDIQAVPYRGDAPANAALIAGEIQLGVMPMATTLPLVQDGQLKALAIGGAQRSPAMPNVPTIARDHSGLRIDQLAGLFRAGRHAARDRAATAAGDRQGAEMPEVIERLRTGGNEGVGDSRRSSTARFRADIVKFAKIIADAKIPKQD